jgi:CBS domain-containing protein
MVTQQGISPVVDRPEFDATAVAADVMTAAPRTCSRFSRVIEAVMIFKDEDCGLVPVVEEGKPIGVLTDRDVALALIKFPDLVQRPIEEIMTTGIVSVSPETSVSDVIARFGREAVRRLLVVDRDERLVGVISWKDVCGELSSCDVGDVVTQVVATPTKP